MPSWSNVAALCALLLGGVLLTMSSRNSTVRVDVANTRAALERMMVTMKRYGLDEQSSSGSAATSIPTNAPPTSSVMDVPPLSLTPPPFTYPDVDIRLPLVQPNRSGDDPNRYGLPCTDTSHRKLSEPLHGGPFFRLIPASEVLSPPLTFLARALVGGR